MADSLFGGSKRYDWVPNVLAFLPAGSDNLFTVLENLVGNSEAHEFLLLIAAKSPDWEMIKRTKPALPGVCSMIPSFKRIGAMIKGYRTTVRRECQRTRQANADSWNARERGRRGDVCAGMVSVPENAEVAREVAGEQVFPLTVTSEQVAAREASEGEGTDEEEGGKSDEQGGKSYSLFGSAVWVGGAACFSGSSRISSDCNWPSVETGKYRSCHGVRTLPLPPDRVVPVSGSGAGSSSSWSVMPRPLGWISL